MTELEIKIRARMELAAREDRERFFNIADTLHLQPKYIEHLEELEVVKQSFRDITELLDFPNIDWPPKLPEWFPEVHFASNWGKDIYIEDRLEDAKGLNQHTEGGEQ